MKKKVIIHGPYHTCQTLSMQLGYVFNILAIFDRNPSRPESQRSEVDGISIISNPEKIKEYDFDYILVTAPDFEGVQREYKKFYGIPEDKIIQMQTGHHPGKRNLFYCLANEIYRANVPGSVVELGVDYGETSKYINFFFYDRKLYLFDTFSGFSKSDVEHEKGLKTLRNGVESVYDVRSNESDVLTRMYFPEKCEIRKGTFPDSLDGLEDVFSFVHIDCDLSKPIADAIEYFYPRLSPGGYMCVHDFYNPAFPGVRKVVREWASDKKAVFVPVPWYAGVVIAKSIV